MKENEHRPYTPDHIQHLGPDEVFVFGSNLQGQHAGGAARTAYHQFGARWGQGVGLAGQSYAIPTMQGGPETIRPYVDEFIAFARSHGQLTFYVTRIGCGIAGFRDEQIAPLFARALDLPNVRLPETFVRCLTPAAAPPAAVRAAEERHAGCLLGGAAGDALGYAVEFDRWDAIEAKYGPEGIAHFELNGQGVAEISDDTQMTLFTANGLLCGEAERRRSAGAPPLADYVARAYVEWLHTQTASPGTKVAAPLCRLLKVPALYSRRGPGLTCLSALTRRSRGLPVENDSCGCGGVMRVAPVGLLFARPAAAGTPLDEAAVLRLGADCARCTHLHPLGYLPAAVMAYVVACLARAPRHEAQARLETYVERALALLPETFPDVAPAADRLASLLRRAMQLAAQPGPPRTDIGRLGEGWTGHEALAIALYCCCRHRDDFAAAIRTAVNHNGDSDSTGAVAGNLMGAMLGRSAIAPEFLDRLELRSVIEEMARDLCHGLPAATPRP